MFKHFNYEHFVLPFAIGVVVFAGILFVKYYLWLKDLNVQDRKKLRNGFFSKNTFAVIEETVLEGIFHRRIFRQNFFLGYMHMSFAFGWFMLILVGAIESKHINKKAFNMIYDPIFLNYFNHQRADIPNTGLIVFLMDFFLLLVLSGLLLALIKRIYSRLFGLRSSNRPRLVDKTALLLIWLVFPLRTIAELFTAGIHNNGGFFTNPAGIWLSSILPAAHLEIPAWWAYSMVLGLFLIILPFSRYMHIPTEILLIALRHYGINQPDKYPNGFTMIEANSCPACGICIDQCVLQEELGIRETVPNMLLRSIRDKNVDEKILNRCLFCGKCEDVCPVLIKVLSQKQLQRNLLNSQMGSDFTLPDYSLSKAEVAYYAGCMTHLNPGIKKAITNIFNAAKINYVIIDENADICCGRPLKLSGMHEAAGKLKEILKTRIKKTEAILLVTSCPICLKTFVEDYNLDIRVMHHSEYILQLANDKLIRFGNNGKKVVFHDSCELGRGLKQYEAPRKLINLFSQNISAKYEKEKALCCGGSLAYLSGSAGDRDIITKKSLQNLLYNKPEVIATSCPMCKQTFSPKCKISVKDLAELASENLLNFDIKASQIESTLIETDSTK